MMKNLTNMIGLDLYLSSLSNEDYSKIEHMLISENNHITPLLSWDVFSENHADKLKEFSRNQDIVKVLSLAEKFNWQNDMNATFEGNPFEAIVVTDVHQNIIWVNDGFTEMSGYLKKDALNKTPSFLQGSQTSHETKSRFRKKLSGIEPFTEVITNYKKNNELYKCEVKIFPLFNKEKTHYMALERQVG